MNNQKKKNKQKCFEVGLLFSSMMHPGLTAGCHGYGKYRSKIDTFED